MQEPQEDVPRRLLAPLSWLPVVTVIALMLAPRSAAPLVSAMSIPVWALVLLVSRRKDFRLPDAKTSVSLAIVGAAALFLAIRSLFAEDPRASLVGNLGQHSGSLMWVGAAAVLLVLVLAPRKGDALRSSWTAGGMGAFAAALAILEQLGLGLGERYSLQPSGLLENSLSLAQVLLLSAAAGLAVGLAAHERRKRVLSASVVVLSAAGVALTASAGAFVAVPLGAAFGAVVLAASKKGALRAGLFSAVLLGIALLQIPAISWLIGSDTSTAQWVRDSSHDRATIWSSALLSVGESPLVGSGVEQFSGWATWTSEPGISVMKTGTYDPHNLILYLLLGGGAIGLILALTAGAAILWRALTALRRHPSAPVAILIAGLVAWASSLATMWTSPLAVLLAAVLAAPLMVTPRPLQGLTHSRAEAMSMKPAGVEAASLGVAVLLALVSLAGMSASAPAVLAWAEAIDRGRPVAGVALDRVEQLDEPSLLAIAVSDTVAEARGRPERAEMVLRRIERLEPALVDASSWHVDAALARFDLEITRVALLGASWERVSAAVEAGRKADPATGLWDYLASVEAAGLEMPGRSREHARAALAHPLPPQVREYLVKSADPDVEPVSYSE